MTGTSGDIGSATARARVDVDVCYVGHLNGATAVAEPLLRLAERGATRGQM